MKMINETGKIYVNPVKNGWLIQGIGETKVIGRDKQKQKSRLFKKESDLNKYLKKYNYLPF